MSEARAVQGRDSSRRLAAVGQPMEYLAFSIAGETYAVGILQVKEILSFETITKVPSTPRSVRGVMNLRGSVVPVVDLAIKFGLPESCPTKRSCVVIVETTLDGEICVMGVMADAVSQVIELRPEDIEPPPPFGTKVRIDYLIGMGKAERKFILLLDIDKVLSAEELMVASRLVEEDAEESPEGQGLLDAAGPTASTEKAEGERETHLKGEEALDALRINSGSKRSRKSPGQEAPESA